MTALAAPSSSLLSLEVPRGALRAGLAAVQPHMGRDSDDTPGLGRLRCLAAGDSLLIWASDRLTSGLARIQGPEYLSDELCGWDLPASAVKKLLAVFRPPSNVDARQMWEDAQFRVDVSATLVTVTEVGSLVSGESLTVARVVPYGDDTYPDVPRELTTLAATLGSRTGPLPSPMALIDPSLLARFVVAERTSGGSHLAVHTGDRLERVLVRVGHDFLGSAPAYPGDQTPAELTAHVREQTGWWASQLIDHQRPLPVRLSPAEADDLTRQAENLRRTDPTARFHIVSTPTEGEQS